MTSMILPLRLAIDRFERAKEDSDATAFFELLYLGEFVLKLTAAGMIAAIDDDRDRHRYGVLHKLVRADGVGEWAQAINDVLSGPTSQFLVSEAKEDRRAYTERLSAGTWQHTAVLELLDAAVAFGVDVELPRDKVALRSWFDVFPALRNKTRGHGAPKLAACTAAVGPLERSIVTLIENSPVFSRQWCYLRQNLSGKYHVVPIGQEKTQYEYLSSSRLREGPSALPEGLYVFFDRPRLVQLVHSDIDLSDFFVANGGYTGESYEAHSPLTDNKQLIDATDFGAPASDRPASETSAKSEFEVVGRLWSNAPPPPERYVPRPDLEKSVQALLADDRHPIVTLVGRGGIGKTSLALTVLHRFSQTERFGAIIWFSARDIDLTQSGPKLAKPDILSETDIARQFTEMLLPANRSEKGFRPSGYMADNMSKSSINDPLLFVFDNFETVRSPVDVFNWIDTNIRSPNKVLITTRFRDFKADYPIEISGMGRSEVDSLIDWTAERLHSTSLFTSDVRDAIFAQSDGHPYVVKIVVGEISDKKRPAKPEKIIAGKEDILQALFERTYNNISMGARRLFLTLCGWRSYIPQIALEAVALRNQNESLDATANLDELDRMSLIQRRKSDDGQDFVSVPLAASIFGQRKLAASPLRTAIELDIRFLQELGPTAASSVSHGVIPRIRRLVQSMASKISDGRLEFSDVRSTLEFIASRLPEAWLLLADLAAEIDQTGGKLEAEYLRRYLEIVPDGRKSSEIWERLANLYRTSRDVLAACDAFTRAYRSDGASFYALSNAANWLNNQIDALSGLDISDRKAVFMPMAALMERRIAEASATDLSRLAWLHLHAGESDRSIDVATKGLKIDPDNVHCQRLIERLQKDVSGPGNRS